MTSNVFIVGLDDFHRPMFDAVSEARGCKIHGLLEPGDLERGVPFDVLVEKAEQRLGAFSDSIDGIGGYGDHLTSCLVPILCRAWDLPSASLDAVVRCEHKYLSRLLQREVIPEHVPSFALVEPFVDGWKKNLPLEPPFWLKPIKSFNAHLGFRILTRKDWISALERIQKGIRALAEPFEGALRRLRLPPEVAQIDPYFCIAEELAVGRECTAEGWVYGDEVAVIGIVDALHHPRHPTIVRRSYPSSLPREVQARIREILTRAIHRLGFDYGAFSAQLVWDESKDRLWLLEINPRSSPLHASLFERVDGAAHHAAVVDLALGRRPDLPHRRGQYRCAAGFHVRRFVDAPVLRAPDAADLERIAARFPDARVRVFAERGMQLSQLPYQDSYGYEVAWIDLAGKDETEILSKYHACERMLGLQLEEVVTEMRADVLDR